MPEPKTALKDLGRGPDLAMLFWLASLPIRLQAFSHGARYRCVVMHPSGADLAELAGLIDAGKLKVIVHSVFSFAKIGEALAYLEKGHAKGKVVVRIANE
jgi:NADPH:quinone reductase-like Zn-dependent oxidoreductase